MAPYRHNAWQNLVGVVVEVRREGVVVREGLVEDAMADSSALWIAADGSAHRVLIEAAEGYEVWVEPRLLEGKFAYRLAQSPQRFQSSARQTVRKAAIARSRASGSPATTAASSVA